MADGSVDPRFNTDAIIHSPLKSLLASQVLLRCLDRDMAKQKLNLLKLATGTMTQTGARATKIVWGKFQKT